MVGGAVPPPQHKLNFPSCDLFFLCALHCGKIASTTCLAGHSCLVWTGLIQVSAPSNRKAWFKLWNNCALATHKKSFCSDFFFSGMNA